MSDAPNTMNGVTVWVRRVVAVAEIIGKLSASTLLVIALGFVVATYYGWIRSPYSEMPQDLREHDERRTQVDKHLLEILGVIRVEMVRNNNLYRIRVCSEIRDADIRNRCLNS